MTENSSKPEDVTWLRALVERSPLLPDQRLRAHWQRVIPWLLTLVAVLGIGACAVARVRKASRTPDGCASTMASWGSGVWARARAGNRCGSTPASVRSRSRAPRSRSAVIGVVIVAIVLARDDHKHAVGDPTAEQPFDRFSGGLAVRIQAEHLCDGLPDPSFRLGVLAPATRTGAFAILRP